MPLGFLPRFFWSAAAITALAAACTDNTKSRDAASASDQRGGAGSAAAYENAAPADTVAAVPYRWDLDAVRSALQTAGLAAKALGPVTQPFMSVGGTVFQIGEAELQVFIYGDVGAMMRDVIRLDTARVSPPAMMISWRAKPSLLTRNNLAAIIVTRDEALRRRIRAALTVEPHVGQHVGPD
ncbi:MAG: hypothetical protein H0W42_05195 [Gemmatimonadaceae bacterium]|nr:hypothetical protein [Gemmatimonadaceae bacterium]